MAVYLTDEDFKKLKKVLKKDKELYSEVSEIIPLLKEGLEEGKYYSYQDEIFFKAVKITEDGEVWGYGLLNAKNYKEHDHFADLDDCKHLEEITKEEFLEHITQYAVDVLGFREGTKYLDTQERERTVIHEPTQYKGEDSLHCGKWQGLIFEDGKFAEVIEKPKEVPTSSIWEPTTYLGYKRYNGSPVLQQKWVETNTGAEEWREIETV